MKYKLDKKKFTTEEALEIIKNYVEAQAREHGHPCDGITECGECYLCEEFKPVPAAFEAFGIKLDVRP